MHDRGNLTTDKKVPSGGCAPGYGDDVVILKDLRSGFGFLGNNCAYVWPTQEHVGELGYESTFPLSEVLQLIKSSRR